MEIPVFLSTKSPVSSMSGDSARQRPSAWSLWPTMGRPSILIIPVNRKWPTGFYSDTCFPRFGCKTFPATWKGAIRISSDDAYCCSHSTGLYLSFLLFRCSIRFLLFTEMTLWGLTLYPMNIPFKASARFSFLYLSLVSDFRRNHLPWLLLTLLYVPFGPYPLVLFHLEAFSSPLSDLCSVLLMYLIYHTLYFLSTCFSKTFQLFFTYLKILQVWYIFLTIYSQSSAWTCFYYSLLNHK